MSPRRTMSSSSDEGKPKYILLSNVTCFIDLHRQGM